MSLNNATPSIAGSQALPLHSAKVEACLAGLHKRADVDSTAHAIVALVSRELDSEPSQTLRQLISTTYSVLLARTTRECYASLAALHASVCISIVSAVPSYVHDPAICTAAGVTFSTRQLVHHQILAAMRDAWHNERKTVGNGSSLRRVTLCTFVDELWCRRAATDRLLYDYLGLLCLSNSEGLDLEVTCLCHILLRRGQHLWRQPDSRPHIDELYKRLSAARKCIEGPSLPFDILTKLDELRGRGWNGASDAPTGLTALKDDAAFRALLSRLGAISRDNVCSRWVTLGWPIVSQADPNDSLPPGQQDQWLTSWPSLPKLDTNVDISLSMTAPILQLSWETFDIVVAELARWACRCDEETYPMSSLISMLERDLGYDSSWRPLYERAVHALLHVPGFKEEYFALPPTALPVPDGDDSESDSYADADGDTTAVIRALLGVLTTERFTSVSDQIIVFVNNSAGEAHAETLAAATQAIFEAAMEDEARAPLMARLCRKVMEQISDGVMDEGFKNSEGQPIKGGLLFRKYLLNRCQEDFERGCSVQAQTAAAREKAEDDAAKKKINEASQGQGNEEELYSDEYYAAQKAKRRGVGLVRLIGELFKLQMIPERIVHGYIKKLVGNVDNPGEEESESICKLLSTVGQALDTPQARTHMDSYGFKNPMDGFSTDGSSRPSSNSAPSPMSALATARIITDINQIQYPDNIKPPRVELNMNAKEGKFRYDRDFLMQFMEVCREKPHQLPPAETLRLEPIGAPDSRSRRSNIPPPMSCQNSTHGLGFMPSGGGSGFKNPMGCFNTGGSSRPSSISGGPSGGVKFPRDAPMARSPSDSVSNSSRTRSQRDKVRDKTPSNAAPPALAPVLQSQFEPVQALHPSRNAWSRQHRAAAASGRTPEVVQRKVKSLLNKLTMERFDSISDQMIKCANESEKEKDGRTLIQVIRLVFEKATDESEMWSYMYARLCRKMMEQISDGVMDEGIKNAEGQPVKGGLLFRKYLLNRCQDDFELGWSVQEHTAVGAKGKVEYDAMKKINEASQGQGNEEELYSDEYYAAQKAKRRGLGLVRFIGELFKLQMLTERIMHECIKKLFSNADNPGEEEIESICKLLSTVGRALDTSKARSHMDIYFKRMRDLSDSPHIDLRMKFMLQDVIELRERKWVPRKATAAPTTDHTTTRPSTYTRCSLGPSAMSPGLMTVAEHEDTRIDAVTWRNSEANASSSHTRLNYGGVRQRFELTPRTASREQPASQMPTSYEEFKYGVRTKEKDEPLDADLRQQIMLDMDEFFAFGRLEEGEQHFAALPENQRHGLVDAIYRRVLKGTNTEATLAGHLFERAFGTGEVTADILKKGLLPTIRLLADIAIDTPNAYALTARMLSLSNVSTAYVRRLAEEIAEVGYWGVRPKDKLLNEFKSLSSYSVAIADACRCLR